MSDDFAEIKSIHDFPSLVRYLRKELACPSSLGHFSRNMNEVIPAFMTSLSPK
jgi:hypothetical protein